MTAQDVSSSSLGDVVAQRISRLQQGYLARISTATAQLAALRAAATAPPGSDARVWDLTVAGISPEARGDAPTRAEASAHAALTLFAMHQQSRLSAMHRGGYPVGRAVRELGERTNPDAVRRRFEAFGTSATWAELLHHARGLVRQLRSADVPLDYGALANDLLQWQDPQRVASVRLRWGRDYHRVQKTPTSSDNPTTPQEQS